MFSVLSGWRPTTPAHHSAFDDQDRYVAPTTPVNQDYLYRDVVTPKTPGEPGTPGLDPRTPNTTMEAPTPYEGQAQEEGEEEAIDETRLMIGVEVTLGGKRGYVKDLLPDGEAYNVQLLEGDQSLQKVAVGQIQLVVPAKNDTVRFVQGDASIVGQTGSLLNVDDEDGIVEGIVELHTGPIKVVKLHDVAKVYS